MRVLIVDYGMCNLGSVYRAFEECGADAVVSDDPAELKSAAKIILPGVGSFQQAMENLELQGWVEPLREAASGAGIPLLGICLGMQLLADSGEENGGSEGLGLLSGRVTKLNPPPELGLRIPHVGWNEITKKREDPLLEGITGGTDFYFVHSFHFVPTSDSQLIAVTPYGLDIAALVRRELVWGVQFHPEKSGPAGFQLIKNFLAV